MAFNRILLYTESMYQAEGRLRDFPLAVMLFFIFLTVSERIYVTGWTPGLETIPILGSIGVLLGLTLGVSRFKAGQVAWLAVGYSLPLLVLILVSILSPGPQRWESLLHLLSRLEDSILLFIMAQPVKDTALFITFISIVFWIISLTSGFALTRKGNFSGAVIPAGVVLVIIQLYDSIGGKNEYFLGFYFFLSLLLLGRLTFTENRAHWKKERVAYLEESGSELNTVIFITTLILVILAWTAPSWGNTFESVKKFWTDITQPFQNIQEDLGQAVAGIEGQNPRVVISFGDALSLGRQAATGDAVYFTIVGPRNHNPVRYYWRVRSYNVYSGGHWATEGSSEEPLSSNDQPIMLPDIPTPTTSRFSFSVENVDLSNLVTPGHPVWVNTTTDLSFFPAGEGFVDPLLFHTETTVTAGNKYVVEANTFEPTIFQLRQTDRTYPEWVTDNYLQLPPDLSPDITNLALQISSSYESTYDIATAVTSYLRSNMKYSPAVQDPPEGVDPVEWFLFNSKAGFCNYFASAEVILLRSVGIPSRLSVGFAQGEFKPPSLYTVRESDAHAWPEVYFPEVGWVEFEPTTSQETLNRPLGMNAFTEGGTITPQSGSNTQFPFQGRTPPEPGELAGMDISLITVIQELIIGLLVILVVLGLWITSPLGIFDAILVNPRRSIQRVIPALLTRLFHKLSIPLPEWLQRWMYYSNLTPIEKSFAVIYQSLRRLRVKYPRSLTPAQAAALLEEIIPDARAQIKSLLHEHHLSIYSRKPGNTATAGDAERMIRFTTLQALLQRFWKTLSK